MQRESKSQSAQSPHGARLKLPSYPSPSTQNKVKKKSKQQNYPLTETTTPRTKVSNFIGTH